MTTRRRWTPETILTTLEPLVAELGHFPTRAELAERGLSGLPGAMQRNGGLDTFKAHFETPEAPAVEITHEVIAERAYFIALDAPHADPFVHWITAERELTGAAA
jgi:hypothetical protein